MDELDGPEQKWTCLNVKVRTRQLARKLSSGYKNMDEFIYKLLCDVELARAKRVADEQNKAKDAAVVTEILRRAHEGEQPE